MMEAVTTVDALPALLVQVEGRVISTNLDAFAASGRDMIARINTDPKTDEDFDVAASVVKRCKESEELIDTVTAQALGQMTSVDQLVKTMAALKAEFAKTRLALAKKVDENKAAGKAKIVGDAQFALMEHIAALNTRIGGQWVRLDDPDRFKNAIKGLSSFSSMRERVASALAAAKIEASDIADRIEANRKVMLQLCDPILFPDFAQVCTKAADDFAALVALRVSQDVARKEADRLAEDARIAAAVEAERKAGEARAAANDQRGKPPVSEREPAVTERQDQVAERQSTPPINLDLQKKFDIVVGVLLEVRELVKPEGLSRQLIDGALARVGVSGG